jgi:hypothetical protein
MSFLQASSGEKPPFRALASIGKGRKARAGGLFGPPALISARNED